MILRKNFIYRYKDHADKPLCIYICDTQAQNKILIIPLTESSGENTYKLSVTKQYAALNNYKEINSAMIVSPLYLNSQLVKVPDTDLEVIHQFILNDIMSQILSDANKYNTSTGLFESIYQFLKWKHQKLRLNVTSYKRKTTVYENGLYWASLGVNVGSELNKSRPVLIWKKRCSGNNEENFSYIVIPITSKDKSKKYYMNVPIDINGRQCYLRIEDMRRINIKRLSRPILDDNKKIIFINDDKRSEIIEAIKRFYIFKNNHTVS